LEDIREIIQYIILNYFYYTGLVLVNDNNLYCSPIIVRVIKSRRMRWAGHVARTGEERGLYRVLVGKSEGRNHRGDLGVGGG